MTLSNLLQVATVGISVSLSAVSFAAPASEMSRPEASTLCDGEKHEESQKTDNKKTEKKDDKTEKKTPTT
jgi:hypothetical protein